MEDSNNNDQLVEAPFMGGVTFGEAAPVVPMVDIETGKVSLNAVPEELIPADAARELSGDQLASIVAALKAAQPTNFKARFQGTAGSAKAKIAKYWFNGELVTKEAHDKLSWEEIHASNNVIRK